MKRIWDLGQFKDHTALLDESGNALTYGLLEAESSLLFNQIRERCLAFCLCQNEIGSVVGYTSFMNNGVVPVLLNSHLDSVLLNNLITEYKPAYLWVPKDQVTQFQDMTSVYEVYNYCLLKTCYEEQYPLYEDLGLLLTTSGSTGSPKFVRQSYENVLDNAQSIVKYLELDCSERPITTLPMNYTYGLSIINSHLLIGATILLTERTLMQKEFWSFFKSAEATSFGGVPYTFEMLDKLRFFRMKLPSLRTITQAGGKILPLLHEKFAKYAEENHINFVVMYGQCEATARMGYLPPSRAVEKKGSMGIAIPGGRFRLIDIDGKEINMPFTTGELVYEGKNVTLGYAECGEDLSRGDERHGILETGDMAQFDEDGFFYIVGRKKRFLKIYGNRVNLDELDRLIKGEFDIEVASTGTDDHLFIFLTDANYSDRVLSFVVKKTNLNIAAFKIIIIDEIPKNDSGKTLYNQLVRYFNPSLENE